MSRRLNASSLRLSRTSSTPTVPWSSTSGTATIDARDVVGLLGEGAPEARVEGDVRQRQRLARLIDVADEALIGRDRQADDALTLVASRDPEDDAIRRGVVQGDRRGLGIEQRDGRLDDRAQDGLAGSELEPAGGLRTEATAWSASVVAAVGLVRRGRLPDGCRRPFDLPSEP